MYNVADRSDLVFGRDRNAALVLYFFSMYFNLPHSQFLIVIIPQSEATIVT